MQFLKIEIMNIVDQITSLTAMETLSQSNPYFGV